MEYFLSQMRDKHCADHQHHSMMETDADIEAMCLLCLQDVGCVCGHACLLGHLFTIFMQACYSEGWLTWTVCV